MHRGTPQEAPEALAPAGRKYTEVLGHELWCPDRVGTDLHGPDRAGHHVTSHRDTDGTVAVLAAEFPRHGGEYMFLPGGRREPDEAPEECARRELREEAGVTARARRSLGSYAITLDSAARIHPFLAEGLTCGPQQLTPSEEDFKLI